jgi:hypothetical protein
VRSIELMHDSPREFHCLVFSRRTLPCGAVMRHSTPALTWRGRTIEHTTWFVRPKIAVVEPRDRVR